jgi:gluconolactonase
MAELRVLAGGLDHPEGLAWDPRGSIVAGGEAGQLYRIDPATGGVETIATAGGYVLGVAIDGAGRIYWCDQVLHAVMRFDPATGEAASWSRGAPDVPFRVPNSLVFDDAGRLYVSESGSWPDHDGAMFVIEPDGRTRVVSTECRDFANGVAIDPAGAYLYVAETSGPSLARFASGADGSLGPRELVTLLERTVPDGLAFAADGRLLISCFRPDAVLVWDGATVSTLVDDWTGLTLSAPTNIAFFGDGLARLAAANIAFLHIAEIVTDVRGAPLRYPELPS